MTQRERVESWFEEHPDGTQKECSEELGIHKSTVSRVWHQMHPEAAPARGADTSAASRTRGRKKTDTGERPDRSDRTERVNAAVTPDIKQALTIVCALKGISMSDWIEMHVREDYKKADMIHLDLG